MLSGGWPRRISTAAAVAGSTRPRVRSAWPTTRCSGWPERPEPLRPRTVELYQGLLRRHILPTFGPVPLNRITSAWVRTWFADLRHRGVGESTRAKAYRLLRGILATAVDDDLLGRNPCRLRRAGAEHPAERRPPTLAEVDAVAAAIEPRFRALVLLAA
jgi:hypothetical protein